MDQGSFSLPILPSLGHSPHSHKIAAVAQVLTPHRASCGDKKRLYIFEIFLSKSENQHTEILLYYDIIIFIIIKNVL